MAKHADRKRLPARLLRWVWIAVAGMLVVLMILVFGVFRSLEDEEPHDPEQARNELEERTSDQVEESRERVDEIDQTLDTDPQPPREDQPEAVAETPPEDPDPVPPVQEPEAPPEAVEEAPEDPVSVPAAHSPELPDEMFDSVVLIGADASGYLADSIILALFPEGGSPPALVSIPRDLYLYNFCSDDYRRVNANLGGCPGYASGAELLSLAVEEFTGIRVDHYVRVGFEGFVELVDGLGGIELCFEYPTYDEKAGLDIAEASCRTDGATALAYARSRNALQLVDGQWQRAWSSDFTRQQHQRELLLKLAGRLRSSSLTTLLGSFQNLSHAFSLDRGWSVVEAVEWAWRYRDFDPSQVTQLSIPVEDYRTTEGAQVLLPTVTFNELLSRWWGPARR